MKIEEAIPEIRKGRRWRPVGQENWRGPWKPEEDKVLFSSWRDLDAEFELEPELEVIKVHRKGHAPWLVSNKGWNCAEMDWELSEIDDLKIAADKVRGIKDSPEYRDPTAMEWYAAGVAAHEGTRLDSFKKGHRAGWDAYEKARKEKA